jgi:hypothetical protein
MSVRFKSHAQIQHYRDQMVEFQPEHLLCEECWELASSAYAEALCFGGAAQVNFQRVQIREGESHPIGEKHGMFATITKRKD